MLPTRLWKCSPALPVFAIARWEGWRACFWLFAGICAASLGVFLLYRCVPRPCFPSAHLVFEFLFRLVFLLVRVLCYLRLFCLVLRYFVVVDGSLCPLIDICFVS